MNHPRLKTIFNCKLHGAQESSPYLFDDYLSQQVRSKNLMFNSPFATLRPDVIHHGIQSSIVQAHLQFRAPSSQSPGGFLTRVMGSGSRGSRQEKENEEINDNDNDIDGPTSDQENMQVSLSRDPAKGFWWDDKVIKDYVTWSFTRNLGEEYFTKWSEASRTQRVKMYTYFRNHVKPVDRGYDPKQEWQKKVTRRITTLINGLKYVKEKPHWVPETWWDSLKTREKSDPKFVKISKINKANRMSGSKDGKALGTHTLGRKSCSDAFNKLGDSATPYKMFEMTKKNKHGEWVNPRAAKIDAAYKELMSQPTPTGKPRDEFRSYYDVVNGFDKKSRLFGIGDKGAEVWYEPPCNNGIRRSFFYTPTMVTKFQILNTELKEQLQNERATREILEEQVRQLQEQIAVMQKAWDQIQTYLPADACSGIPPHHRRDDFADDKHNSAGSPVG